MTRAIDLYDRPSPDYASRRAELDGRLRAAAAAHPVDTDGTPTLTLACSLGVEDMLLAHAVNALGLALDLFVLDTGALHPESLSLLKHLTLTSSAPVRVFRPDPLTLSAFVRTEGDAPMYRSVALRKACCAVRKLEPLGRALAGRTGWITGLRREQSEARAEVPLVDHDTIGGVARTKYNPLADWTWGDVWHAVATEGVATNALHDRFYPSIGCAPCTRAISLGEPFRAGRWWWEDESAKECGLHVASAHAQPGAGYATAVPEHGATNPVQTAAAPAPAQV